jgi:hypothetical protein
VEEGSNPVWQIPRNVPIVIMRGFTQGENMDNRWGKHGQLDASLPTKKKSVIFIKTMIKTPNSTVCTFAESDSMQTCKKKIIFEHFRNARR